MAWQPGPTPPHRVVEGAHVREPRPPHHPLPLPLPLAEAPVRLLHLQCGNAPKGAHQETFLPPKPQFNPHSPRQTGSLLASPNVEAQSYHLAVSGTLSISLPPKPQHPLAALPPFFPSSQIKKEGMGVADVAKEIGAKWKELSDAEKAPYQKKADKEKERYEKVRCVAA
jgi:hypothetical protein